MPTPPPATPADPPEYFERPAGPASAPRKLSRRASIIGTVIALLVAAGLAWLAWELTRPEQTAAIGARPGGGGGGGGGPGGGG
ncbi:MAG TPA: hypothetical protein VNB23_08990, partial [Ramlibacter sp.]|nr:hypothetical protein [Ramlibacter sp.]